MRDNSLEEVALIDKKEVFRGKSTIQGRHSRKPEENRDVEVLSNSVCMETVGSMKAENDARWGQFGIELKKKKKQGRLCGSVDESL